MVAFDGCFATQFEKIIFMLHKVQNVTKSPKTAEIQRFLVWLLN